MSLRDLACYTLTLRPHEKDKNVTELISVENGRESHRFARVREERDGEAYSSSMYGMSPLFFILLRVLSTGEGLTREHILARESKGKGIEGSVANGRCVIRS